jgi:hypothetical protein
MIEEIKPEHQSIFWMKTLYDLLGNGFYRSYQSIIGCIADAIGIDSSF